MVKERVYIVDDYWDGVRSGIADYCGTPHYFECMWGMSKEEYTNRFTLIPIDNKTFELALERWAIFAKWSNDVAQGKATGLTHPALPGQNPHYAELEILLKKYIFSMAPLTQSVEAMFYVLENQPGKPSGIIKEVEVEWKQSEYLI